MTGTHEITVWDRFVRLFHWSVASAFLLDFWVLDEGDSPHEWVGYFLGVLLVLRIIWGFIGPHNARFINFFPTLTCIKKHLSDLRDGTVDQEEGHNPLGGAMVITLMLMLAVVSMSGWMLTWDIFWGSSLMEEIHDISANVTMILVVIHVAAIIVMGRFTQIPLIRTMVTGKRLKSGKPQ